ncbi:DUF6801 domain-containing protein [Streptomyces sp. NBC_00829]|uniref:DUF6801 domain-containing protein n=1 Tax=Streptomyces sp. NBC_00829 TaxID=2903679 RepID=UPI0038694E18|nr:hypothetical protein OG293_04675 [Streptomyces sp. NBC_00829]
MPPSRTTAHRPPRTVRSRTTVRGTAVAVAVLAAVMIPGARAADAEQRVDVQLAYTCDLLSPKERVSLRITATFPEDAEADRAIRAEEVTTTVTLPDAARSRLAERGAVEVSGTTRLTVAVAQRQHTAEALWSGTAAQAVTVPASGDLTLAATGAVPLVKAGDIGELTFTAGALAFGLSARTADGGPAEPAAVPLTCVPAPGQEALLATVPVTGTEGSASPVPTPTPMPSTDPGRQRDRAPGLDVAPTPPSGTATADVPPCVGDTVNPFAMVAYLTGYSNVAKLKGASEVPVSCTRLIDVSKKIVPKPDGLHLLQRATGELDHLGRPQMPPAPATFLAYGFMPTTATMELTQLAPMTIDSDILLAKSSGLTLIRVPLVLRLRDVRVNGVPLDVGPNCRTTGPLYSKDPDPAQDTRDHMVLTGVLKGPGNGYQLVTGGVLTATMTIPPFSGCGVDEDLDALFTSAISGPGNYLKQVQAAPCASGNPRPDARYCTADHQPVKVPKPER